MSIMIGIDLGTSTTEAAVFRDGKPEMVVNLEGKVVTPSVVGIDPAGNWLVGEKAKAQYLLFPENTAIEIKRKTGSDETIPIGKANYAPVELQARLLSYVRNYVTAYLGEDVTQAVISVPAYFNEHQRRETRLAGERAGFSVERILNEPTAAAMSYGLEHMDEESHVLVYDLGGGTFDVTLLEMFDGVLEVKASSGDNQLGGKDFDEKLMDELCARFLKKFGVLLREDKYAMVRLKDEAERCKLALSESDECRVRIPAICTVKGEPVGLDETITREQFEALTRELLERTHAPIDSVLRDAELDEADIDHIILVGGSTRMPMVASDIERYLGEPPISAVDPDYAVAQGTAIMAGIISGKMDDETGLVMTDVNPFTLGVRTANGDDNDHMSVVIPRNTTIPVTRTEGYTTSGDYQTEAKIEVYQGESEIASHNHFLGEFTIGGIPPRPAGREKLSVTFAYDLNGLLNVTATLVSTGKNASIEIDMGRKARRDVSGWKDAEGAKAYRTLIRTAERMLKRDDLAVGMRERIEDMVYRLKVALLDGDDAKALSDDLNSLLNEARD